MKCIQFLLSIPQGYLFVYFPSHSLICSRHKDDNNESQLKGDDVRGEEEEKAIYNFSFPQYLIFFILFFFYFLSFRRLH